MGKSYDFTETNSKNPDSGENHFYSMWNFVPDTLTLILFSIGSCQLTKYLSFSYVTIFLNFLHSRLARGVIKDNFNWGCQISIRIWHF